MDCLAIAPLNQYIACLYIACLAILILAAAYFWVIQFAQLMALSDTDFPGRHDKALWVAAFVFTCVFAAFAFLVWRRIMLVIRASNRR